MIPTPTLVLLTALLWTLPASAAVLTYRAHDSSLGNLKASLKRALGRTTLQPRTDA